MIKTIRVVAAVIKKDNKILCTQRGYGEFKGRWEFPGGKIEDGETPKEALVREIKEELDVRISVGKMIKTTEYDYPEFHLSMDCFWCGLLSEEIELKEHKDAKWLDKSNIDKLNWLPADKEIVKIIKESMNYLTEEELGAKNISFKTTEWGEKTLVKLTKENVVIAEALFRNDSSYSKAADKNAKPQGNYKGSSAYWISQLPSTTNKKEYKEVLEKIINILDNENSTHLNSDTVGRRQILNRIVEKYANYNELEKALKSNDLALFNEIEKKTRPCSKVDKNGKKIKGRKNPSFASKFCHYLSFYLFEKEEDRDRYPIYDRVIVKCLPLYLEKQGVGNRYDLSIYEQYRNAIDAVIDTTSGMSRNGLDHLLWLYHKGRV